MISPAEQWCIQIDVTNVCPRQCSNCTHLVGHRDNWYMEIEQFRDCLRAVKDFPTDSPPAKHAAYKLIGIIGGEPLLHPDFELLAAIMEREVPYEHRGLWTGIDWPATRYAETIARVFPNYGIHWNPHHQPCVHTPVLVAVAEIAPEVASRLIDDCWLQRRWSSSFTPWGFFCCEVMGCLATVFGQVAGLSIEPGCWQRPLEDFRKLIDTICPKCGVPLNLRGRAAGEEIDDITLGNLGNCQDSPKIQAGKYEVFNPAAHTAEEKPWEYLK